MRKQKDEPASKKGVNAIQKGEKGRHKEFETPSQQRNRDGLGREQNGSDGNEKVTSTNH
jgi:hypothetical protein